MRQSFWAPSAKVCRWAKDGPTSWKDSGVNLGPDGGARQTPGAGPRRQRGTAGWGRPERPSLVYGPHPYLPVSTRFQHRSIQALGKWHRQLGSAPRSHKTPLPLAGCSSASLLCGFSRHSCRANSGQLAPPPRARVRAGNLNILTKLL